MSLTRRQQLKLFSIGFSLFATCNGHSVVFATAPEMVKDFGYPEERMGTIGGLLIASYFMGASLNVFWGRASDFVGRRPVLLTTQIISAGFFVAFGAAPSFGVAFACRLLAGVFDSRGVARAAVAEVSTDEETKAFSMGVLMFGWQLAFVVSPITAGVLTGVVVPFLHQRPFFVIGLLSGIVIFVSIGFLVFFFVDENEVKAKDDDEDDVGKRKVASTDDDVEDSSLQYQSFANTCSPNPAPIPEQTITSPLKDPHLESSSSSRRSIFIVTLLVVVYALTTSLGKGVREGATLWGGLNSTHGGLGLPVAALGHTIGLGSLSGPIAALFIVPALSRRFGDRGVAISSAFVSALFTLLHPLARLVGVSTEAKAATLGVVICFQRIGTTATWQCIAVILNARSRDSFRGFINGASESASVFACAVGPILVGWMVSSHALADGSASFVDYGFAFICLMIGYCVVGAALWMIKG